MQTIFIIYCIALSLVIYTYLIYPLLLSLASVFFKENKEQFSSKDELPKVSIIMASRNEEEFMAKKIDSLLKSKYPTNKVEILIGSDASTDQSNEIVRSYSYHFPSIKLIDFKERQGKIKIINKLAQQAEGDVFILTDTKAIFSEHAIFELVKHYKNPNVGIVGANILNKEKQENSNIQEQFYMNYENKIKHFESKIWKIAIGVFGAAYSIKKELWTAIPENYLVDDLFVSLEAIRKKKQLVYSMDALVYESVSLDLEEEIRRKKRIGTGNFQLLAHYGCWLLNPLTKTGFLFISHKFLRWISFALLIILFFSNIALFNEHILLKISMFLQILIYLSPLTDKCLLKIKIQIIPLRFITHFVLMNYSMLVGLINFIKGVKSNVWEPTQRR